MQNYWETIIGLEVHVQLATASKLFSGVANTHNQTPNTQASLFDLAIPGVLPILNQEAVNMAIKFGTSINATIAKKSIFERKNYFYPDLTKGYQITQQHQAIITNGYLDIISPSTKSTKRIIITNAHLEEDTGKLLHKNFAGMSAIDFNRAGIALLEIVSAPALCSAPEALIYLETLYNLIRYLEICDGNMQEGSLRCDVNLSVHPRGTTKLGTRTEIKNLNSFRFIERAIDYETQRQIALLEKGKEITPQTLLFDEHQNITIPLRHKEEEIDYRYFPDPDLLPLIISAEQIEAIRQTLPELPQQKFIRFQSEYNLNPYDASILSATKELADYFEATAKASTASTKIVANWIINELLGTLNKNNIDLTQCPIPPLQFVLLLNRVHDNTISNKIAKEILSFLLNTVDAINTDIDKLIAEKNLQQITCIDTLEQIMATVIANNPEQVAQYQNGKTAVLDFLIGKILQASQGRANPQQVKIMLKEELNTLK